MPDIGPYDFLREYRAELQSRKIPHPFGKTVRSGYWPAKKPTEEELAKQKEASRFVDNMDRKDVEATLWLGISRKDYDALQVIAEANPTTKSYAVLVRRLINAEAKRILKEK